MIVKNESDALNFIRWASTFAIVLCHFLQAYGNSLAFVFNIGVQIFFILSGFLYGKKGEVAPKQFYYKRLTKLYIPYLIWITIAAALLFTLIPSETSLTIYIKQAVMRSNMPGLDHLWFMQVIFCCYLILPLINYGFSRFPRITLTSIALLSIPILAFNENSFYIWILLYYVGYIMGRNISLKYLFFMIATVSSLYILFKSSFDIRIFSENSLQSVYLHASLGTVIFTILYLTIKQISLPRRLSHILTNRGGYELYLTHHLFIIGPLSTLFISENNILNIFITICLIIISTIILIWLSDLSYRIISYKRLKAA